MALKKRLHLFEAFGVELEYMIVHRDSLNVAPICDKVLATLEGETVSEVKRGAVAWSNELAMHVLEIKSNGPSATLHELNELFQHNLCEIEALLAQFNATLLPTAAHPWMNPDKEMKIWPHEQTEIYHTYNRLFDCRGHGWSNLQSTHINLPFGNDEEFGRLHAAIRLLLPIFPALAASSPIIAGKRTGMKDTRMEYYRLNQKNFPLICGSVIPEAVFSEAMYRSHIYAPMMASIAAHDPDDILEEDWLNSRGAIARFDRGAIEIRILDIQECPLADLAILALVVEVLKGLCKERWISYEAQQAWSHEQLSPIFLEAITHAEASVFRDKTYPALFGHTNAATMAELWAKLYDECKSAIHPLFHHPIEHILREGTLSTRILKRLGEDDRKETMFEIYSELAACLRENRMF